MPHALVTGGTAGIGAAFARALAARGYDLVLVARTAPRLEEVAAELRATGRDVEVLVADLGDPADVQRVAERLADAAHPIDLLVNNAGYGMKTKLSDPDLAEAADAIQVMMHTPLVLSAAAVPGMRVRGRGIIVNVASVAGYTSMGLYAAIKAWMRVYSESLSNALHGTGVTVTALLPGWVHTEFHDRAEIRKSSIPSWLWLSADGLVEACLRDAERGRAVSIPTVRYRFLTWLLRHLPMGTVRWASRKISGTRHSAH
ncbi:SDR family NAD(P)-dependent oxidoreductase [Protaetiibacter sp. SSC-01]|uniref:SDR family NAD(P)-dependent oxidoreductase n=1 Tax=Protaetiibacter sp. SSC-01 TaxID=2759943 RepID=UPI0016572381|nr:SDR family NAD(P)-dependent oxidoreductase [Protaetiibacter sp. SSC-01]QNO37295.1 SDR family NAD(P)-dependent oxidoreductase [Protaetiibacter sp. SSC-01]